MRITPVAYSPSFKSGYPTFGTAGHLSKKLSYDPMWDIYWGYYPKPDEKNDGHILYNA